MKPIVIIGTGVAAYTLAREFRKLDSSRPLILISSDDGASYPKPMLSNALTKGKTADQIVMATAEKMAETLSARILNHEIVVDIDRNNKSIQLASGITLEYEKLILALGASPIRPSLAGDGVDAICSINNLEDYSRFRERLQTSKHVVIIGAGLIGCELANDLANVDIAVSVIDPNAVPMSLLLPPDVGSALQEKLTDLGVTWQLGKSVIGVNSSSDHYNVELSSGEIISADLVISAIGLRANMQLAKDAGLTVAKAIITDTFLQTSDPNIFAIGDCAEVAGHNLMYIAPALLSAKALALTLSGNPKPVSFPAMPIAIKTPCYPIIVCPPMTTNAGSWGSNLAETSNGLIYVFADENDNQCGFVLSGEMVSQKNVYSKLMPDLF